MFLWHSPKHVVSTVDYTVERNFSWRHGLLLVLYGGHDWEIIAPMCFFFDIRSPLTNPTKYLVMMDSREIWGVTTAYIFCTFARLFTPTVTFLPVLWITKSVQYLKLAATVLKNVNGFQYESVSRTETKKTCIGLTNAWQIDVGIGTSLGLFKLTFIFALWKKYKTGRNQALVSVKPQSLTMSCGDARFDDHKGERTDDKAHRRTKRGDETESVRGDPVFH